jgi:acetylornithine/N-succinyldiaminopimelate aminotransferase
MTDALMNTYARADLAFERGEGAYLYGTDGRRYLDFASGIAVTALGHAHPHLVQALTEQAGKLWHTSNLFRIPDGEKLAARLCEASFADRVFFCNSGLEAFEGAVKLTRRYFDVTGQPDRHRVITFQGAFHGRSLMGIASAGNPKYMEGFGPHATGFRTVAFNNPNELRDAVTDDTAAIMVEPVQGEGGIRPAALQFLRDLRTVCDEFGLLLVYDEIQCGMGRTGKLFAHEWAETAHEHARPDVMLLAKGLGGGFPVGAVLATEEAAKGFQPGSHGTTFGGNPLAMACGNAVLDVMTAPGFLEHVRQVGDLLRGRLESLVRRHPRIFAEVRGAGLMLGLRCQGDTGPVVARLREGGLLTVGAAENTIRLLPPLILEEAQVEEAMDILESAAEAQAAAA